jgi:hypothetical protein
MGKHDHVTSIIVKKMMFHPANGSMIVFAQMHNVVN